MVSTAMVMFPLDEVVRNGRVITIPSLGLVITSVHLSDKRGAIPALRKDVVESLARCIDAQLRMLGESDDPDEDSRIWDTISELGKGIADPSVYILDSFSEFIPPGIYAEIGGILTAPSEELSFEDPCVLARSMLAEYGGSVSDLSMVENVKDLIVKAYRSRTKPAGV